MNMYTIRRSGIVLALLAVLLAPAMAAPPVNILKRGLLRDTTTGIAVNGYDVVAYFTDGKPLPGADAYSWTWNGALWKFASQDHLERFKAKPERYAPQYGGYCAYGVSQGYLVTVEPEQFTILDDKLYLNYSADVQQQWSKDIAGYNRKADAHFPELLKN